MGNEVKLSSFIAGFTAACVLAGGVIAVLDFTIATKSSLISKKELDENYIHKSHLDKLYILKSDVDEKYTKNETVIEKYIDKSIIEKSYVSKDDYEKLKKTHTEFTSTLHDIPKPFTPLRPQLEHISSWRDEKLGVALELDSRSWSETKGSTVNFNIKLPNSNVDAVTLKDSDYQMFRPRFDVNNRTFEIRLINIKNLIFEINEVVDE